MSAALLFELPNPFQLCDSSWVRTAPQWQQRRLEMAALMIPLAYGELPPAPRHTACVELHAAVVQRLGGAHLLSYRVEVDREPAFAMRLFLPAGRGPFPVVLNGDACWHYACDAVVAAMLERGYVFAQFNRVEVASDRTGVATQHNSRVFRDRPVGALAAWAWPTTAPWTGWSSWRSWTGTGSPRWGIRAEARRLCWRGRRMSVSL